jgi:hypothetical protein
LQRARALKHGDSLPSCLGRSLYAVVGGG